jgi:hypothetical protein
MANATNRNTLVVPSVPREELKVLLGDLLIEALAGMGKDVQQFNTEAANDRDGAALKPKAVDSAKHVDIATSPAEAFFSDVKPVKATKEDRVKEAIQKLQEAERILAYANPNLGSKSRRWGVNSETRRKALESIDGLVQMAIRDLTSR